MHLSFGPPRPPSPERATHKHPISPCRHQSSLVQNKLRLIPELGVNVWLAGRGGEGARGGKAATAIGPSRVQGRPAGLRERPPSKTPPWSWAQHCPGAARVGDDVQPRASLGASAAGALAGV